MDSEVFGAGLLATGTFLAWLSLRGSAWTALALTGRTALILLIGIVVAGVSSWFGDRIREKMELKDLTSVPILIVRAPADDTTLPLTFLQFIAWAAQWVYWFCHQIAKLVRRTSDVLTSRDKDVIVQQRNKGSRDSRPIEKDDRPLWVLIAPLVYALACLSFAAIHLGYGISLRLLCLEASPTLLLYTGLVAVTPIVVAVLTASGLALTVYVLASIVAALASFLVGPELAVAGLFMDVSVEAAPRGPCDFVQLSMADTGPSQLQHSTHSNPAAIAHVAAWLRALSGSRSATVAVL